MRKNSRIAVYKILFSKVFNSEPYDGFEELIFNEEKLDEKDIAFARELISAFNAHESIINDIIAKYAQGYSFERLFAADKCAMQICVTEMLYSALESPNFVNGILAQIKKSIESGEIAVKATAIENTAPENTAIKAAPEASGTVSEREA